MDRAGLSRLPLLAALAAALAAAPAAAETAFMLDLTRDTDEATAVQFGIAQVNATLGWHLEIAHSNADGGEFEDFTGDDFAFGLSAVSGDWYWSLDADYWVDSSGTDSLLWTVGGAHQGERWRLGLEYADGSVSTSLPDIVSLDIVRRDYSRRGARLLFERRGEVWRLWGDAAEWSYDPELAAGSDALLLELQGLADLQAIWLLVRNGNVALVNAYLGANGLTELQQVLATQGLAGLTRVVRYQQRRVAYALALHSFALGLSDPTARLGVERGFGDSALSLEYEVLEIPVDGLRAQSLTLAWRTPLSAQVDFTVALGAVDTEDYGSSEFIGLTFEYFFP